MNQGKRLLLQIDHPSFTKKRGVTELIRQIPSGMMARVTWNYKATNRLSYLFINILIELLHRFPEQVCRERLVLGGQLGPVQQVGTALGQVPVVPDQVARPNVDLLQGLPRKGPHLELDSGPLVGDCGRLGDGGQAERPAGVGRRWPGWPNRAAAATAMLWIGSAHCSCSGCGRGERGNLGRRMRGHLLIFSVVLVSLLRKVILTELKQVVVFCRDVDCIYILHLWGLISEDTIQNVTLTWVFKYMKLE